MRQVRNIHSLVKIVRPLFYHHDRGHFQLQLNKILSHYFIYYYPHCPLSESGCTKEHRRDKVTTAAKSKLDIVPLEFMTEQSDKIEH